MLRLDVDELDRTPKEPAYLILEARPLAVDATASILHAEFSHELVQRPAEDQLAALRPYSFGANPGQEQARDVAVRQFRVAVDGNGERVRAVVPHVLPAVPGIRSRQRAEGEQPRHEAEIGVGFARLDELIDLVKRGEVVPGLGRGGGQAVTSRQVDRRGHIIKGHEPADGSRRVAHRSRRRTNVLSATMSTKSLHNT